MPLIKSGSKKAIGKNIEMEMASGKPHKQSIAIALSVQRKNKRKKMASGGEVNAASSMPSADSSEARSRGMLKGAKTKGSSEIDARKERMSGIDDASDMREMAMKDGHSSMHAEELDARKEHMAGIDESHDSREMDMLDGHAMKRSSEMRAASGMPDADSDEERPGSVAAAIMHRKRMAKGGEVDLDENAMEAPNDYDDLNAMAADKDVYAEDAALHDLSSPMDSNELGHELPDEDEHERGMISMLRAKIKAKRI